MPGLMISPSAISPCNVVGATAAAVPTWEFEIDTTATSVGSSNNDQFKLPLVSTGTYDFTVDWGDSSSDDITVWNDAATTHTYAAGGTYTVKITGTIEGIRFNNTGDRLKIGDVSSWGPLVLTDVGGGHFYGCTNLACTGGALTTAPEIGVITNFASMFFGASSFTSDLSAWDVSSGTNFGSMFREASSFTSDLSAWDVSSGTNFGLMFRSAQSFTSDLSAWDVSSGTNFLFMFYDVSSFTSDLSAWDVSSGTSFTNFANGAAITTAHYDATLIGWEALDLVNSLSIHFGTTKYTSGGAAEAARAAIIADDLWTITDGGPV